MVSNAMVTGLVAVGTVVAFMWLGQFTSGIFEDMASLMHDINTGVMPAKIAFLDGQDVSRLQNFLAEVTAAEKNK